MNTTSQVLKPGDSRSFNDAVASLVLLLGKNSEYKDAADSLRKCPVDLYDRWKPQSDNGRMFFLRFGVLGCAHRQYLDDLFWRGREAVLKASTLSHDGLSAAVRALSPTHCYGGDSFGGDLSETSELDRSGDEY